MPPSLTTLRVGNTELPLSVQLDHTQHEEAGQERQEVFLREEGEAPCACEREEHAGMPGTVFYLDKCYQAGTFTKETISLERMITLWWHHRQGRELLTTQHK